MTTLHIEDMTCGGCVAAITNALRAVDAAAAINADLPTRRVRIESTAATETLAMAIRQAGFAVRPI